MRLNPAKGLREGSIYDAEYHRGRKTKGTEEYSLKRFTFRLHLEMFRKNGCALSGRRLLDVGCATGDFLEMAAEEGVRARGVELSAYAASCAVARGLEVLCGRIDEVADGPYDLIHSSHVLEHVPDIRAFAVRVAALLRPGGGALIEVPNEYDDLFSVAGRAMGRDSGKRAGSPHIHFFSPESLRRLFRSVGLLEREFLTYSHQRQRRTEMNMLARLRWVHGPNALLGVGDALGKGRNNVLLVVSPDRMA